jgi:transcription antitermination factor NusG
MPVETQVLEQTRSTVRFDHLPMTERRVWTVLQVKSRQEKALADDLWRRGIDYYLPLVRQQKIYGGRKFQMELPLFPGYVFLFGTTDDIYTADRTRRVSKIIEVHQQKRLAEELSNLRLALENSSSLTAYPFLKTGVQVEVCSGPFRGLRGLVEHWSRADRLILQIETLGRAVSLEIGPAELEAVA